MGGAEVLFGGEVVILGECGYRELIWGAGSG